MALKQTLIPQSVGKDKHCLHRDTAFFVCPRSPAPPPPPIAILHRKNFETEEAVHVMYYHFYFTTIIITTTIIPLTATTTYPICFLRTCTRLFYLKRYELKYGIRSRTFCPYTRRYSLRSTEVTDTGEFLGDKT